MGAPPGARTARTAARGGHLAAGGGVSGFKHPGNRGGGPGRRRQRRRRARRAAVDEAPRRYAALPCPWQAPAARVRAGPEVGGAGDAGNAQS